MRLILAVSVVAGLVALGARAGGLLLPPADLAAEWVRAVRLGGILIALAAVALLAYGRRTPAPGGGQRRGPDSTVGALLSAVTIMGLLTIMALVGSLGRGGGDEGAAGGMVAGESRIDPDATGTPPPPSAGGDPSTPQPPSEEQAAPDPARPPGVAESAPEGVGIGWGFLGRAGDILMWLLILGLMVLAVFALVRRIRPTEQGLPDEGPPAPADARPSFEGSLRDLAAATGEPGELIAAAYRSLLAALTRAGAARLPHEAPHEHLHRVLGPLGVRPDPTHRLAGLYVLARFSGHRVTDRHRGAAVRALEAALADLRAGGAVPAELEGVGRG